MGSAAKCVLLQKKFLRCSRKLCVGSKADNNLPESIHQDLQLPSNALIRWWKLIQHDAETMPPSSKNAMPTIRQSNWARTPQCTKPHGKWTSEQTRHAKLTPKRYEKHKYQLDTKDSAVTSQCSNVYYCRQLVAYTRATIKQHHLLKT